MESWSILVFRSTMFPAAGCVEGSEQRQTLRHAVAEAAAS